MIRQAILRWARNRKPTRPGAVYVSGPMSNMPELNFPAFHKAAKSLRASGYRVVNPAEIITDKNAKWEECLRADIAQLVRCTHIALLPGYENSKGARLELHIADALGMRRIYITQESPRTSRIDANFTCEAAAPSAAKT